MDFVTIRRPDDFNVFLGQDRILGNAAPFTIKNFGKAVISGGTSPLLTSAALVKGYRDKIFEMANRLGRDDFLPMMSLMLDANTTERGLREAHAIGIRILKFIPKGVFAGNFQLSLRDLRKYYHLLHTAQNLGFIFSVHCELVEDKSGKPIPEINRETEAIPFLEDLLEQFPKLKVVVESISTAEMAKIIKRAGLNVAASITFHHLVLDHGHAFHYNGEINPAFFCRPVPKHSTDRVALLYAILGCNKFFFGSGSIPLLRRSKNCNYAKLTAGLFTSPITIPALWQIFEEEGAKSRFEDFVSVNGSNFYGLPLNSDTITLDRVSEYRCPTEYQNMPVFNPFPLTWKIRAQV